MTIALNIVLAIIVFAGVVGLLTYNIVASRTPAEPKLRAESAKHRTPARQRAYRPMGSARA